MVGRTSRTPARDFMVSRGWRWSLATLVDFPDDEAIAQGARYREDVNARGREHHRRWRQRHQSKASPRAITISADPSAMATKSPVRNAASTTLAPQPRKAITKRERPSAATAV